MIESLLTNSVLRPISFRSHLISLFQFQTIIMEVFGKCIIRKRPYIYVGCVWFIFLLVYKHGPLLLVECLVCVPLPRVGFDHFPLSFFFFCTIPIFRRYAQF